VEGRLGALRKRWPEPARAADLPRHSFVGAADG
jgi:hypothetical protein